MHASSFENMERCVGLFAPLLLNDARGPLSVLEVGSHDVNGSYRSLFTDHYSYTGADLGPGPNVDVVLEDPHQLPFDGGSLDLVISGQMLEHSGRFWKIFGEMARVVSEDGFLVLITPSAGPIHRYPVDCYRFYPDAYAALAEDAGIELLYVDHDTRGPWNDLVGIFSRRPRILPPRPHRQHSPPLPPAQLDPVADQRQGAKPYLEVLAGIHAALTPEHYLEIGVRHGDSLRLAHCRSTAVDPSPELATIDDSVSLYRATSDDFFRYDADQALTSPIDLAFIDGMHMFENVLRDFMHVEQRCTPGSAVVIDDVLPNNSVQASRERRTVVWTGDVWKITECLRAYRPDLSLTLVDSDPSGLLLVSGLDPTNRVLWANYNPIVREFLSDAYATPPTRVLERTEAVHPDTLRLSGAVDRTHPPAAVVERKPSLSVVVIAHDMAREIPRTLLSLSPRMQRGIDPGDYEVIVVDNGSSQPFDRDACTALGYPVRVLDQESPTVSPSRAINVGLAHARGQLCGVMIDGARMASPGLLAGALTADRTHPRAIVATVAFHLGSDVQMVSVHHGYDQIAEDGLLASVDWQGDGYRLFDISVFAGSSAGGWLHVPTESNALFMSGSMWDELGGYDEAFVSPGGGLVNHDTLLRACALPGSQVVMLLGEATFHQVHGGVATNALSPPLDSFTTEYVRLRKMAFVPPDVKALFVGHVPTQIRSTLATSLGPGDPLAFNP